MSNEPDAYDNLQPLVIRNIRGRPMRDKYHSDNRDLIKWATLAHIALEYCLKTILQVPYWRPESNHPYFNFMEERVGVSSAVWTFFRNIHSITRLGPEIDLSINVIREEFDPDKRKTYISRIKAEISRVQRPLALFLDPDTGLQPKKCLPEHTASMEVEELWPVLEPKEWLILYQHARRSRDWSTSVANQLSSLCDHTKAYIARSEDVGKDFALICLQKNDGKA
jgi:hypothetical protein